MWPDVLREALGGVTRQLDPDPPAQRRRQLAPSPHHNIRRRRGPAADLLAKAIEYLVQGLTQLGGAFGRPGQVDADAAHRPVRAHLDEDPAQLAPVAELVVRPSP